MYRLIILWCLLFVVVGVQGQSKVDCVLATAEAQVGVREATGHNDGTDVEKYLASVGLDKGNAWCAATVNWILEQCGVKTPKSGWCPTWFPENKIVTDPRPGDVFGMYFPAKNRIAHMGLIVFWGSTYVKTIEGNTNDAGSREGDGVYRKIRLKKQIFKVARYL